MQFASDKKRLDALKFNATRWLGYAKRTTPGVALAGIVQSCEPVDKVFELKLATATSPDAPTVSVVLRDDPKLKPRIALVLGTIVDNPGEQLLGYNSSEPMVVWSGMTLKLPAGQ